MIPFILVLLNSPPNIATGDLRSNFSIDIHVTEEDFRNCLSIGLINIANASRLTVIEILLKITITVQHNHAAVDNGN